MGFGTFFAVLITAGFWLLAIPFYPKRCVVCGSDLQSRSQNLKIKSQKDALADDEWAHLTDEKTCPFCAEKIKMGAKVCRFCGKDVT